MPYIRGIKDISDNDEIINQNNSHNFIEVVWEVEKIGQFRDYYKTEQSVEEFIANNTKLKETTFEDFFYKVLYGDLSAPLPGYNDETKEWIARPVSVQSCTITMSKQGARVIERANDLKTVKSNSNKLKKIVIMIDENSPGYICRVCYDAGNGLQSAWNLDEKTLIDASYLFRKSNTGFINPLADQIYCALPDGLMTKDGNLSVGNYKELHNEHDCCFAASTFDGIEELIARIEIGANNPSIMCPVFVICNGREFFINEADISNNKGITPKSNSIETIMQLQEELEKLAQNRKNKSH